MATHKVRVQLSVDEDLSGVARAHSALDAFNQSATAGFARTQSAMTEMSKTGMAGLSNLTRTQAGLTQEINQGSAAGTKHASVLKQIEDRQKSLTREAKTAQQVFRAARQELLALFGAAVGNATGGRDGIAVSNPGMIYSNRAPSLASTLGLPTGGRSGRALGDVFSHGIGPLSGTGLAMAGFTVGSLTVGNSNRAVSALGGMAGGAMIGTSIMPGIGTAVGAAIGGIVGLLSGGDGKNKRHDADIANQGFAQLRQILDDYYAFRRDYATSIDQAYKIWQQMESKWVRRQSAATQRPYFDQIVNAIGQTEDERNRRRQVLSMLPVPEFASGGYVGSAGASSATGMLALVHAGEFVMTRQAVDRIGTTVLQGLNSGTVGTATAASSISIEPASASTLANFLKSNPQALDEGLLVVLRRGGPASRALRG
ncbi:MAG: hypothetical protein HYX72_00790 [Acidobacteria bacterium]|nr:hypothetical protein [Acidobacteriota bacterium]